MPLQKAEIVGLHVGRALTTASGCPGMSSSGTISSAGPGLDHSAGHSPNDAGRLVLREECAPQALAAPRRERHPAPCR